MKKKILGSLAVFAVVAVAAFNIHVNMNDDNGMTALSLANVEALADDEGGAACPSGCKDIGWGTHEILKCDCTYTGYFSSCYFWGC